jgi:hypothetical protein
VERYEMSRVCGLGERQGVCYQYTDDQVGLGRDGT